jgi:hypothetical protein
MAHINFKYLKEQEISTQDYLILQCCKQMKYEDISDILIELCKEDPEPLFVLEGIGFVEFIKGKVKESLFSKARLTKKGNAFMENVEAASITEEDVIIWDWLVGVYKAKNKDIGNSKKGKLWLSSFRVQSGINRNKLSYLCKLFINDDDRMEYSQRLDYVFFKPPNHFSLKFDLEESKLWKYYLSRKEMFDAKFKTIEESETAKK